MTHSNLSNAAKNLIETSRNTLVGAIGAGQETTRKALRGCDEVFVASADTLGYANVLVTSKLRDELVSLEGQLTLLANFLARSVASQSVKLTNGAASIASDAADKFDQVFDLRVIKTLNRIGLPAGDMIEALAARVTAVATEIDRLIQKLPISAVAPAPQGKISAKKPRTTASRRTSKRTSAAN